MGCKPFQLAHAFGLHKETLKTQSKLGIVEEAEIGGSEFKASLICNVPGQPEPHRKILSQKKKKKKKQSKNQLLRSLKIYGYLLHNSMATNLVFSSAQQLGLTNYIVMVFCLDTSHHGF